MLPTAAVRRLAATLLLAACAPAGPAPAPAPTPVPATPTPATPAAPSAAAAAVGCCLAEGRQVAERHRVAAISTRRFTHASLWSALDPIVAAPGFRAREIGRSIQGRPIRAVTFGQGPTTVLLWSQMHGDESTATMALADVIAWLADRSPAAAPVRERLARELTIVMVPMLNPDGAELFQRENAAGVDVNRDARRLATPEARALKSLRDSLRPGFGFNLHDQSARILTGSAGRQVAIALLAPAADASRRYEGARVAARLVAAGIAATLEQEIPGRIAKYEDDFNPRAFGDLMQQWGTSTVLIESGALPGDPEKQRLRAVNVVALVGALDAIATRGFEGADPARYERLPTNARTAVDVLVRGAHVVLPGAPPMRLDLALNYEEPVAKLRPRVREVGDLATVVALDTIEAEGLFLHPAPAMLTTRGGGRWLRVDAPAAFTLRRAADLASAAVRAVGEAGATTAPGAPAAGDTLRIDGSPGVRPLVEALARAWTPSAGAAAVRFGAGLGSAARVEALARGEIDVAMASHGVDTAALRARGLVAHEIAKVAVVFAVNAGVPVAGLTTGQLCDVYRGRVPSWRALGGPALAVAPRMRPDAEVDAEVVHAAVACFPRGALAAPVAVVERPEAMAAELASRAGAIGVTSLPFVEAGGGRIRALALDGVVPDAASVRAGRWPLVRRSWLLTRAEPSPAARRFLDFVRGPDGAAAIEGVGAVPVP